MNSQEDLLNLKWRNFQDNAASSFRTLREEQEYADVTLVCEDGLHVEAHKAILASSSPFFLNLLKENQNPHPLIFMADLKSEVVLAMMDFLYHGETNLDEQHLKSFHAAAEELKLKGIANLDKKADNSFNSSKNKQKLGKDTFIGIEEIISRPTKKKNKVKQAIKEELPIPEIQTEIKGENYLQTANQEKNSLCCNVCIRKFTSKKCFKKHVLNHQSVDKEEQSFNCDVCKSTFNTRKYLKRHVKKSHHARSCECPNVNDLDERNTLYHTKTVHLNYFGCNICLKTFTTKSKSTAHIWDHNGSSNFQCDNCGKEYKSIGELNAHKKSCVDQEPTNCDLCEKVFKGEFRMQKHKNRSHKDLHQCPECSTQVRDVEKHMLRVHTSEKRFPCSKCDKGFITGDTLKSHIRSVHDKEKPYDCRFGCGVKVSESGNRRKHEKQKHGQIWLWSEGQ